MSVAVYGGSFNPPHLGHVHVADAVRARLAPRHFLIVPACIPPHKELTEGAGPEERMEMARLAFGEEDGFTVSDMEIARGGTSYTSDTLRTVMAAYPGEELLLVVGTDMFLSLDRWHEAEFILKNAGVCVVRRDESLSPLRKKAEELGRRFGAKVQVLDAAPVPAASSEIRALLPLRQGRELLPESVYACIIRRRLYGARPEFAWLREQAYAMLKPKRVPHVRGCEQEAVRLAERWGADREQAAEAGILHDITKKLMLDEQLILCGKYGIITDTLEASSEKLLHAKTGAAVARDRFGVDDQVYEAIRWHTTGRAGMSLLEKIVYMADYIEPTRDFEGVDTLRALAYENLDKAMILGLEMSLEDVSSRGQIPHENTIEALNWFRSIV